MCMYPGKRKKQAITSTSVVYFNNSILCDFSYILYTKYLEINF